MAYSFNICLKIYAGMGIHRVDKMKFRVKALPISAGNPLIAVVNYIDALKYDLHSSDRILIKTRKKQTTAIIDLTDEHSFVMPGEIGLLTEVCNKLDVKTGDIVSINVQSKPMSITFIKKKLNGNRLSHDELRTIVNDVVNDRLSEIELTYFVSSSFIHELSISEIVGLTKAMINTGEILKLNKSPIVDKHCIGGVAGNRTTMVVVPIVAAAGLAIPKTSSRSITSAAGTADTVEVLCDVSFPIDKMKKIVSSTNGCLVWGGSVNLAPADDKFIKVEHPMSLDPVGQLISSILAKKKSVSATHVVIDIPVGKDSKTEKKQRALMLKRMFEVVSRKLGLKLDVLITDGSEPIGNGIGPALEARDVLWTLLNDKRSAEDLRKKSLMIAGRIFELVGKARKGEGIALAADILDSGLAYEKFIEIIKAQNARIIYPDQIELAAYSLYVRATKAGKVKHISNKGINKIARIAGSPYDKKAGLYLYVHKGHKVKKGDKLFKIYSDSRERLKQAKNAVSLLGPVEIS